MGESAVALRYAQALYGLAKEQDKAGAILEDLAALKSSFDGDREGFAKLMHPRVSLADKESVLNERFLGGRDPLVANLIRLIVARRREGVLNDFFGHYLEVHEENEAIIRVEVETATEMEASVAQSIRQKLEDHTGKKVVIETRVMPELLGGMRMRVGSRLVDGSTLARLQRIERGLRTVPVDK